MKNLILITTFLILVSIFNSCRKEIRPTITTAEVSNITGTSATSGGTITDEGSGPIIASGVCWSAAITTPNLTDSFTTDGAGAGTFTSNIGGLIPAITYYLRAYATNEVGVGYGMTMSFTTMGSTPLASISAATNVTNTSATLNGSINANYLSTVVTFEYGTTTSYGSTITATQSPVTGNSITNVSADITGLTAGTTYHFRVKAENSLGTTYGNDMTFTPSYSIGQNVNGGIIFYIDGTGQHGLVCAPSDQSTGVQWYWGNFTTTGATATALGTGMANTNIIVAAGQTAGVYAAKLCYDLVLGGYSDWYLPSKDELNLLYLNKGAIGNLPYQYWSSSESSTNAAWSQYFDSGGQISNHPKSDLHAVRAIRSF